MSSLHLRAPAASLHKPGPAERWLRQLHPGTIRPPRADSAREPLRPQTKFPKYHDQNEKHQRSRGKCLFRTYWIPNTRCSLGFLVIKTPAALLVLLVSRNISSGSCSQGTKISPFFPQNAIRQRSSRSALHSPSSQPAFLTGGTGRALVVVFPGSGVTGHSSCYHPKNGFPLRPSLQHH